ncbi:MAG: ABC transporter permease, partial [Chloroflexota bacterium]|nr:ABC transporter permease [Chloroflexota bacterium]
SRLLFGARVSLIVSALAIVIGGTCGLALGAIAGYRGGRLDAFVMRLTDITLGFPLLVLAIFFAAIYGPSFNNVILVISLILWAPFARVSRAETLVLKQREFVIAARAEGANDWYIIWHHLVPHLLTSGMVLASLQGAAAILIEAALSFFGAGVPPPTPSWGGMINDGREYAVTAWWISLFPGLALTIVVLALNTLGDSLRDILDPRLQGTG